MTNETASIAYAAVGSDGHQLVVWGLGTTQEEAEHAAEHELADLSGGPGTELTVLPCTPEAARLVRGGAVACEGDSPLILEDLRSLRDNRWTATRLATRPNR